MADYDDLNTNRIFTIGIISIVVTAVTALAVQVVYYSLVQWHEADLAEKSSYRRQNQVLAEHTEEISNYGVDAEGNLTIPVSQAMQLIATDSGSEDSHSEAEHKESDHKEANHTSADHKADGHDAADHKDSDHEDADHKDEGDKKKKDDDKKGDHKDDSDDGKEHKDDKDA